MPSVNSGPSNSATVNTQTPAVASQASGLLAGLPLATQAGASVGTLAGGLLIGQTGLPVGIASTGTMGANGALTLGTALGSGSGLYGAGIFFNFPAGAVFASSPAGFYFTKMSGTTAGTVFNNTYVAANGPPSIPSALVPVVDAGPGAYTGVTTAQTATQLTLPANVMGNNGALQFEQLISYTNSAGAKTFATAWGNATVFNSAPTTTAILHQYRSAMNRGVPNVQVLPASGIGAQGTALSAAFNAASNDTTQSTTVTVTMTAAAATDNMVCEFLRVYAFFAP